MVDYIKNIKDIDVSANESEINILRIKLGQETSDINKEGISDNIISLETEVSCFKDN